MKNNFIKQNYTLLINSFKRINLKILLILIFDILFYFIFIQVGKFLLKVITKKADNVDLTQNLIDLNQQAANNLLSSMREFFLFFAFSIILFLILMIISWSIFNGLIWSIVSDKKFNLKFFKKFFLLNLICLQIWFLLIILFAIIMKPQTAAIFMIIILIIAFYLTNILYPLFLKENRIRKIKEAFKLGISKIHYFIVPYAIIIALFLIILNAYNLIIVKIYPNPYVLYGIILLFIAWLRYYFVEIVTSLSK